MAGMYSVGEKKVRPGTYDSIVKAQENTVASAIDGTVAVLFKSSWGPLVPIELSVDEGYEATYGTGLTTDALKHAFDGGAKKIIACRLGSEGTVPTVTLKSGDTDAVTIKGKYVGAMELSVTLRDYLADDAKREFIIYNGTSPLEKLYFAKGGNEAAAIVSVLSSSLNFSGEVVSNYTGAVDDVAQKAFTSGTNPTVTTESYSNALSAVESYKFNAICVDTVDTAVHALLAAFMDRIFEVAQFATAVVAETSEVALATRMQHASEFNDEKVVYILNPHVKTKELDVDGYKCAARIAGMIAACSCKYSLTHTVLNNVISIEEMLTNTQIIKAEQSGCLVLSYSQDGEVWIDSAINTLVTPADNQDNGWKKIRRTKTRYELIERANITADKLVGKVDNDTNGRATIMSQLQGVGNAMIEEGKLTSCVVTESTTEKSDADYCYFSFDIIDKDSAEHIYLTFVHRFSTNV